MDVDVCSQVLLDGSDAAVTRKRVNQSTAETLFLTYLQRTEAVLCSRTVTEPEPEQSNSGGLHTAEASSLCFFVCRSGKEGVHPLSAHRNEYS